MMRTYQKTISDSLITRLQVPPGESMMKKTRLTVVSLLSVGVMALMLCSAKVQAVQIWMTVDSINSSAGSCSLILTDHVTLSDAASTWNYEKRMLDRVSVQTFTNLTFGGVGTFTDTWSLTLTATETAKTYQLWFYDKGVIGGTTPPQLWDGNTNSTSVTVNP